MDSARRARIVHHHNKIGAFHDCIHPETLYIRTIRATGPTLNHRQARFFLAEEIEVAAGLIRALGYRRLKRDSVDMIKQAPQNAVAMAASIVSAYVSNNALPVGDVPSLISTIHSVVAKLSGDPPSETPQERLKPAVSVKKSISEEYLVCLEDGRKFKSLKRHLRTRYNMTPEQYRAKWQLPVDYPMVAPGYAATRSQMAKDMGLGQQRRKKRRS